MQVRNINSTSDNKCGCGTWLDHWKKFARTTPAMCSVRGCADAASVGGHVQKEGASDKSWFIIPLCIACNNQRGQVLSLRDDITLVSANVAETCGKTGIINSVLR